ncbi:MAG: gliding motility-associated C-terminal domain-containing protein, partial [Bacteroidota bacterium]|nr:gliding motility-associated C-terminal domain-containing protein [Bacteroidota bacterium]
SDPSLPGCSSTASVSVWIDSTNYVVASNDTTICTGNSVQLDAVYNGPPPLTSIPCGTNNTNCTGTPYYATAGTGTLSNTSTGAPAPYGNYYKGGNTQMLFTAAELNAAGIYSGTITELAFNISQINGTTIYENVEIKMGCTNATVMTSRVSGMQQVYQAATVNITPGFNNYVLNSSFDWDGITSLVVEFCFYNPDPYTSSSSTFYTATAQNSVVYDRSDSNPNICSSPTGQTLSKNRPNIRFRTCDAPPAALAYSWSPTTNLTDPNIANPVADPSTTTTYAITVSGGYCSVTDSVTIFVNPTTPPTISPAGPVSICSGDSIELTSSFLAGNIWNTGDSTQSIFVSVAGNYYVEDMQGCAPPSDTVQVNTTPAPEPVISPAGPINLCPGDTIVLTSSIASGNVWSQAGETTQSITVSNSGSYTVTVTDGNCSGTSAATIVSVSPGNIPTISASGPLTFCQGDSVVLTSSALTDNLWSTGATTQSITVFTSDNITVTDTSNCGGTSTATIVTVSPNPTPIITTSGPTTFCQGGQVTLTSSSSTGNVWSTGGITTQSITVDTSGTYTVTVTDGGCSATSAPTTVTVNPTTIPTITANGPLTFCQGDSVVLTSSNPTDNSWSTGETTQSITVFASANITVTDVSGCGGTSATTTVTVDPNPTPTITASGPTTFCQGDNVILTSSSSTGNQWNTSGPTTQSITVDTSGTYTVTVTDGVCSATSAPTTVTVNPTTTPTITANGPLTFCQGDSVVLTSSNPTDNSWSTGETTQSITVFTSANITVTDISGCGGTSATTTVTVNPNPTPTITANGPTTFCQGDNVTLTSNSSTGNQWNTNGPTTQSITVDTSGTYTVTITDAGCSATSAPTTVTVNPSTNPTITANGPLTFCQGDSVVLISSNTTDNSWSSGETTQSITVFLSSNITVTDVSGCGGTSATTTVTVNPNPTPTISTNGPVAFCQGDSVTLTSSNASGYEWIPGGQTTQSITVNSSDNYSVTITDANGCEGTSASTTVTVNPNPSPVITANGSTTFCQGGSVTLTSSSASGYEWIPGGQTTQSITVNSSDNYSVTVTDANGCEGTSAATTVTVNPNPSPIISASGPTTICQGDSVTLTSSTAAYYEWNPGVETTQSITVNTSDNYSVIVIDGNGCQGTSTITSVVVNSNPTPTITSNGPTTFCQGDSVTLTSSSASAHEWIPGGQTTQSITVNSSDNYSVTVTDANGCEGTSAATTVTVNPTPLPLISASGSTTICQGDSVILTSSSAANYEWNPGAETTQSITVNTSDNYSVLVIDGNGCQGTSTVTSVVVNTNPTPTITTSGPTTFCQGDSVTLTSSSASAYEWIPGGQTTQSITVNSSDNYSVTVTDANGCEGTSAATTVTVNPTPPPTITAGGPLTFCQGDSVVLTSSNSTSNIWSTGATTQSITVFATDNITVTVSGSCGGTSAATNVTVNPNPTPTITASGPTTFCQGDNITLTSSSTTGNQWNTAGPTTQSITLDTSGTYSVTVIDANGCQGISAATTVTVTTNPSPFITPVGSTTFCQGDSVTLISSSSTGNEWNPGGGSTQVITVSNSGNYTVTVTDSNGCQGTSAATVVSVNANPTPTITASGQTTFCLGDSVTLTSSSATGNVWSPGGATTQNITVYDSESYALTVTDSNGCTGSTMENTSAISQQNAAITASGPFCQSSDTIFLSAATNGGSWSGNGITNASSGQFSTIIAGPGDHQIIYTLQGNCGGADTIVITVNAGPPISTSDDQTIIQNESTVINGLGLGTLNWFPSEGLSCVSCNNPTATPLTTTTYYLMVTDANGCSSTDSLTIFVEEPNGEVFIPNIFSPNGDGNNDLLLVYGNIKNMNLIIYNRWGQKIFETTNQAIGWDGTHKGMPLDPAVFVYYLRVIHQNNIEEIKQGNITLIR